MYIPPTRSAQTKNTVTQNVGWLADIKFDTGYCVRRTVLFHKMKESIQRYSLHFELAQTKKNTIKKKNTQKNYFNRSHVLKFFTRFFF